MIAKPNTPVIYISLSGQRLHAVVLHGVPGKPRRAALRIKARKYIIAENTDGQWREVAK